MQNVPKIVRERLKAVAPAVNHPDADVLTAFAEQSLPERERAGVLDHLAHCGDCRDIVALALPATEPVQTTIRPASGGWLTWPTLRWGFVAAGVVAIAAFGLLQYQRRPATMAAKQRSQGVEVAANEPKKSTPFVPTSPTQGKAKLQSPSAPAFDSFDAPSPAVSGKKSGARADAVLARAVPSAGPSHGNVSNSLRHGGPSVANQWPQQNMIQNQAQASAAPSPFAKQQAGRGMSAGAQVPATNQTVEVSTAAPVMATESAGGEARQAQDQAPAPPSANARADVTRAKPAVLGQISGYVVDSSGAVVSDARITVTPTTTGGSATAVTNSQGAWLIAGLPTGNYKAQAEKPGFKTTVLDVNYDASANQPSMYRFTLSPGSVAETVEVSSAGAQVQTETVGVGSPITNRQFSQAPVRGRNISQLTTVSPPRWTINASGALQRSIDQGKSWQTVDVNANAVVGANFSAAPAAPRAKVKDADKALKREIATPTFRAVAATGSDVWAGGSGGALYHSADAGNHWTQVVPAAAGAVLTGDIISLEFADIQHGRVSTSTSEAWMTSDGGQTWQKQ
jgi:hypothetical protein